MARKKQKRPNDAVGAAVHVGKVVTREIEEEPTTRLIVTITPPVPKEH